MGATRYYTGVPCSRGHVCERIISSRMCVLCSRINNAKRFVKGTNSKINGKPLGMYFDGPACVHGHSSGRYIRNRACVECSINRSRKYRADAHPEERNRKWREYYSKKSDIVKSIMARRRARKASAEGSWVESDILRIFVAQKGKCASPVCRIDIKKSYHIDHIMPLARGGSNWPKNLQLLCPRCNIQKNDKHPIEWAQSHGVLL